MKIFRWIGVEALHGVFGLVWPIVLAAIGGTLTMLSGLVSPLPLPYLLAASALVFGAVTWGFVQISILRERTRVKDRLYFADIWVGRDVDSRNGQPHLKVIQLGFQMLNAAPFPMYFRIEEIRSSFDGRINGNPQYQTRSGVVIKDRPSLYRDAPINFEEVPLNPGQVFEANLFFKVKYGRSTHYGYAMDHDINITVVADRQNPSLLHANWGYSGRGGTDQ